MASEETIQRRISCIKSNVVRVINITFNTVTHTCMSMWPYKAVYILVIYLYHFNRASNKPFICKCNSIINAHKYISNGISNGQTVSTSIINIEINWINNNVSNGLLLLQTNCNGLR